MERYPLNFSISSFLDLSVSLITSLTVGVMRLLYLLGFSTAWFVRMDYCLFPKGFLMMFDGVWKAWYGCVGRLHVLGMEGLVEGRDASARLLLLACWARATCLLGVGALWGSWWEDPVLCVCALCYAR